VDVGDVRDLERSIRGRHGRSVRPSEPSGAYPKPLLS
jgi:hypothetical protein